MRELHLSQKADDGIGSPRGFVRLAVALVALRARRAAIEVAPSHHRRARPMINDPTYPRHPARFPFLCKPVRRCDEPLDDFRLERAVAGRRHVEHAAWELSVSELELALALGSSRGR